MNSRCLLVWLIIATSTVCSNAEEIRIELARGQRDPMIEIVLPIPGSPDRVQFTQEGMRIQQVSDVKGKKSSVAGFKTMVPASGDFRAELEADVSRLEPTSQDWGQGLIFAVYLDDPKQTAIKLNQVAYAPKEPQSTMAEFTQKGGNPQFIGNPAALKSGSLIITRQGTSAKLSMSQQGAETTITTFECPAADVRGIEVWCTRVEQGNRATDILLKSLTVTADQFYAFQQRQQPFWTWWKIIVAVQMLVVLGALFWKWRS
jgi:hypothetical protein